MELPCKQIGCLHLSAVPKTDRGVRLCVMRNGMEMPLPAAHSRCGATRMRAPVNWPCCCNCLSPVQLVRGEPTAWPLLLSSLAFSSVPQRQTGLEEAMRPQQRAQCDARGYRSTMSPFILGHISKTSKWAISRCTARPKCVHLVIK